MIPAIHGFELALGSSLAASILAKATVIAVFGLIGARLARRNRAAVSDHRLFLHGLPGRARVLIASSITRSISGWASA